MDDLVQPIAIERGISKAKIHTLKQVELSRFINLNTLPFKLFLTFSFSVKSTVRRNQGTSQALRVRRTQVNVCSIVNLEGRFFFSKLAPLVDFSFVVCRFVRCQYHLSR